MRSKLLLTLFSFAFTVTAIAQPVYSGCSTYPAYGSYTTTQAVSTDTNGVKGGASGANVTWDFSGLITVSSQCDTTYFDKPSVAPGNSNFPTATVVQHATGGSYYYVANYSDSVLNLGYYTSSTSNGIYSKKSKIWMCPFNYGNAYSSGWKVNVVNGGPSDIETGTLYEKYDAYGTLITPAGTYKNVMRVNEIEHYVDSVSGFALQFDDSIFTWYDSVFNPELVVTYTYLATSGARFKSAVYYAPCNKVIGIASIESAVDKITVYPNPSNGQSAITVSGLTNQACLTLYSVTGQKVWDGYSKGVDPISISSANLNPGIYFLQIRFEDGSNTTKKVEIVR